MQAIRESYQGFSLVVTLNWDRILFLGAIALALPLGAYIASL